MVEHDWNLDTLSHLANRIRRVRGGMSRADFAEKIGVHLNTLGYYERGQRAPDAVVLINICKVFAVEPSWLLLGEGPALDEDRIIVESASAGSLRAGEPLARIVIKRKEEIKNKQQEVAKKAFSSETIQGAIVAVEQALSESHKSLSPQRKAELVVVACELLIDMDSATAPDKILKLIRLSA